ARRDGGRRIVVVAASAASAAGRKRREGTEEDECCRTKERRASEHGATPDEGVPRSQRLANGFVVAPGPVVRSSRLQRGGVQDVHSATSRESSAHWSARCSLGMSGFEPLSRARHVAVRGTRSPGFLQ